MVCGCVQIQVPGFYICPRQDGIVNCTINNNIGSINTPVGYLPSELASMVIGHSGYHTKKAKKPNGTHKKEKNIVEQQDKNVLVNEL